MTRFSTLALDLATVTGWAVHSTGMDRPFLGSLRLPPNPQVIGPAAAALWQFLLDQHTMHEFTHIVFEAQHVGAKVDINVVYKLIALGGVTEFFAHQAGVKCYKVHIASWRKHFIGKGSGLARAQAKQRCIAECERYGWSTIDDNAAEACGILDYFLTMLPGDQRPWRDKTFMGAHKLQG